MADGFLLEDSSGVVLLETGDILLKELQSTLVFHVSQIAPIIYYVLTRRAGRRG